LCPGVYAWLDQNDQICYVGKSKSLRKRLLTYFAKTLKEKKVERILQTSRTLVWEPMSDELLALIREQELIFRWRPEFNTQGQPVKRQPAFLIFKNGLAPQAIITRRIPKTALRIYGPVSGTGRLRTAIESINQVFRLRDCPDKTKFEFADQLQLFKNLISTKCIRHELGSCSAPCAARCSKAQYAQQVQQAINFIEGNDHTTLLNLESEMKNAAAKCSFERATVLRDHFNNLKWLDRRMKALRHAKKTFNGILPIAARKNRIAWLILKGGRLLGSAPEPLDAKRASAAVDFLQQKSDQPEGLPESIMDMNMQMILIRWFRKHKDTAKLLVPFEEAIKVCHRRIEGSPAQYHSFKIAAESKANYQVNRPKLN
jgi:excinuclease ABC subunit C